MFKTKKRYYRVDYVDAKYNWQIVVAQNPTDVLLEQPFKDAKIDRITLIDVC